MKSRYNNMSNIPQNYRHVLYERCNVYGVVSVILTNWGDYNIILLELYLIILLEMYTPEG